MRLRATPIVASHHLSPRPAVLNTSPSTYRPLHKPKPKPLPQTANLCRGLSRQRQRDLCIQACTCRGLGLKADACSLCHAMCHVPCGMCPKPTPKSSQNPSNHTSPNPNQTTQNHPAFTCSLFPAFHSFSTLFCCPQISAHSAVPGAPWGNEGDGRTRHQPLGTTTSAPASMPPAAGTPLASSL